MSLGPETAAVVREWPRCAHGHPMRYVGRQGKQRSRWECPECRKARQQHKKPQPMPSKAQEIPLCGFCGSDAADLIMVMHPWKAQAMFACPSCKAAMRQMG